MKYIDGFVLVVPKRNLKKYKKMALDAGKMWIKYGALQYVESVGEDISPNMAGIKIWSFPEMTMIKKDETVVFSYIVYRSRKHRDEVNVKVMKDPSMNDPKNKDKKMPFDMKKMAYGGFETLVDL